MAAIIIIWPSPLSLLIKEWAYVGVGLSRLTVFVAQAHKDYSLIHVLFIGLTVVLIISNI
ncbi:hypothetical protein GCM10025777_53520 [Membranihabitans marinus]